MAESSIAAAGSPPPRDPILSWLYRIRYAYDQHLRDPNSGDGGYILQILTEKCIDHFSKDPRYRSDERLLKITIILSYVSGKFLEAFAKLEKYNVCQDRALLYEIQAMFHIRQGNLLQAYDLYNTGIKRNAQPSGDLTKCRDMLRDKARQIVQEKPKPIEKKDERYVDPFAAKVVYGLYDRIKWNELIGYNGYIKKDALPDFSVFCFIQLGEKRYRIDQYVDKGGFGNVYKASLEGSPDDIYALKVEKRVQQFGAWEFYMYRQLDKRISATKRSSFGFAHEFQSFDDTSFILCDYLSLGSLVDIMNSYKEVNRGVPELICMYYAMEMLDILEVLHKADLIHADFKVDNLLIRYASDELTEEGFKDRTGAWHDQGLCLIDWGRGIDLTLFPPGTEFIGDCHTLAYRCCEMFERIPWTYQVDSYALCQNVYALLHNGEDMVVCEVMDLETRKSHKEAIPLESDQGLWKGFFQRLLNIESNGSDVKLLQSLKKKIDNYFCDNPQRINELIHQLTEGRKILEDWLKSPIRAEVQSPEHTPEPKKEEEAAEEVASEETTATAKFGISH